MNLKNNGQRHGRLKLAILYLMEACQLEKCVCMFNNFSISWMIAIEKEYFENHLFHANSARQISRCFNTLFRVSKLQLCSRKHVNYNHNVFVLSWEVSDLS